MREALPYLVVLSWALVVLASFLGYGLLLARALRIRRAPPVGAGLQMAWGIAFVLAVGGWLCAFSMAQRPVLIALSLLGAALAGAFALARYRVHGPKPWARSAPLAWLAPPALLAGAWLVSSIALPGSLNPNDDPVAYLTYVTRILEAGDLVEPFGLRRLSTFGGHSLLQALVMAAGSELNANVPDRGFGPVLLFALLAGLARPVRGGQLALASLLLTAALLLPVPRFNTASVVTGVVMLVALVSTLERLTRAEADAGALAFLAGMTGAAAGTLRATFLVAAVLTLGLFHGAGIARDPRRGLREGALSLVGGILCLAPWMAALYVSSGTPFFPVFTGNYQPTFAMFSADLGALGSLGHIGRLVATPAFMTMWLPLLAIAGLRGRRPVLALAGGCLAACAMMIEANSLLAASHLYRYAWPVLMAASLAAAAFALREWSAAPRGEVRPLVLTGLALMLFVPALARYPTVGVERMRRAVASLPAQWRTQPSLAVAREGAAYAAAQATTPPGARILTVVDRPFLLDYRRNTIYNVDAIGAASPPPGMPFFEGPDALRSYLLGQSVEWVLARDFDSGRSIYSREFWRAEQRLAVMRDAWRPHFLDFMDNLDRIAECDQVVAKPMGIRLIQLSPGGRCARALSGHGSPDDSH